MGAEEEAEVDRRAGARRGPFLPAAPWAVVVGVAWIVLVAAADVITPPEVVLIGLTVLGAFVAALSAHPRRTAMVAALATATAGWLGGVDRIFLSTDHLVRLGVVVSGGVLAVYLAWLQRERQQVMRRLARVAEIAQSVMLRPPPRVLGHVGLAARYLSASDEAQVGGDLYETAYTPFGVRVILGDVRGKGLDGIRLAATVLAGFREVIWEHDLVHVARLLDERVTKEAAEEDFVTVVLVELPVGGGVRVVNCGHHAPLRIRSEEVVPLEPPAPTLPLGLGPEPQLATYPLEPGERLLLCTDGLLEARDAGGRFFPLPEHLDALRRPDLQEAVDTLIVGVLDHVPGALDDDLAVLLVERRA